MSSIIFCTLFSTSKRLLSCHIVIPDIYLLVRYVGRVPFGTVCIISHKGTNVKKNFKVFEKSFFSVFFVGVICILDILLQMDIEYR